MTVKATRTQRRALASTILADVKRREKLGEEWPLRRGICRVVWGLRELQEGHGVAYTDLSGSIEHSLSKDTAPHHACSYLPYALLGDLPDGLSRADRDSLRRQYLRHWAETGEALTSKTWEQRVGRAWNRKPKVCNGPNCGSTDGVHHSVECYTEYERATALPPEVDGA